MRVLVVEDDPFVREMAVARLEDAGYEVIDTASGSEALNLLQAGIILSKPYRMAQVIGVLSTWAA
jgi:CheY-like chemotaxis protein